MDHNHLGHHKMQIVFLQAQGALVVDSVGLINFKEDVK
jgi:hypothetical protein